MDSLLRGAQSFYDQYFNRERDLFAKLATGQQPQALFITCADSRIDPNLLTQTKPGEIFVLRNAGNIVPPHGAGHGGGGESATIEYALAVLNIKDIIICGHSDCGAMKALLHREHLDGLGAVSSWLEHAAAPARTVRAQAEAHAGADRQLDEAKLLDELIEKNVLAQLENLTTHPAVASRATALRLHAWVYRIHAGEVLVHDEARSRFVPANYSGNHTYATA
jgi:carbonic anhydrase